MEPPFQAKGLRKQLVWLTLACLSNNLGQNGSIDREDNKFLSKTLENGVVLTKLWAWLQIFVHASCAKL